jgi:superoxide dismutase
VEALLSLQDRWSNRLWAALDADYGSFERFAEDLVA